MHIDMTCSMLRVATRLTFPQRMHSIFMLASSVLDSPADAISGVRPGLPVVEPVAGVGLVGPVVERLVVVILGPPPPKRGVYLAD